MASAPAPAGKAIYAPHEFLKFGEGASRNFGFGKHAAIAFTAAFAFGFLWKVDHWNHKRVMAQYYADLAKKEAAEESVRAKAIQAKFQELEDELLK